MPFPYATTHLLTNEKSPCTNQFDSPPTSSLTSTMSDTAPATTAQQTTQPSEKPTHLAGCAIFIVILAVMLFLGIFATYQYFDFKKAVISISQEQAKTLIESPVTDDQQTTIRQKFLKFATTVRAGEKSTLTLDVTELNQAIHTFDKLASFRGKMQFTHITDKHLHALIALPVRAGFDGERFLNGSIDMRPVIAQGSLFPIADNVTADTGKPVPPKFSKEFPTLMFTEYRNDESLTDVFHKLSNCTLSDGKLIILSDPQIKQPDALPEDVTPRINMGLQLFGLLVFIFLTTLTFLLWLKKRKATQ